MPDNTGGDVVPIDPDVRSVLEEFSRDPIAMAAEIVQLRSELSADRPSAEIVLRQPPRPPDALPPTPFAGVPSDQ